MPWILLKGLAWSHTDMVPPCFLRETQGARERGVAWGSGTLCFVLALLLSGQLYDPGNIPELNFPIHQAILYALPTSTLQKTLPRGQILPLKSLLRTMWWLLVSCGTESPLGLRRPYRIQPSATSQTSSAPTLLCSFCYHHPGLLTAPQTSQEVSCLRAFALTVFSACMLSPQVSLLFAFSLHDDVCSNVTLPEIFPVHPIFKKWELLSHFSLFPSSAFSLF